ncbi:MAG TPA: response regulator transcription factor [Spirochaetia bacterium]|nr:response regulator transcription factor [Spirochaetia bacterium]
MGTERQPIVLIVDDEPKITRLVESYLAREGFRTMTAGDGPECLRRFRDSSPDLVILDLGLPKLDGMDVARVIRRESSIPIIMLTARADEDDKLEGLDTGADDYVTKPFSPKELVARVKAVLRRFAKAGNVLESPGPLAEGLIRIQDIEIDVPGRQVIQKGKRVDLTAFQFDLLAQLARHSGQILSREQLLELMHANEETPYDRTVDVHIKNLRRLLGDDPGNPRYIETVRGIGYRFLKNSEQITRERRLR